MLLNQTLLCFNGMRLTDLQSKLSSQYSIHRMQVMRLIYLICPPHTIEMLQKISPLNNKYNQNNFVINLTKVWEHNLLIYFKLILIYSRKSTLQPHFCKPTFL